LLFLHAQIFVMIIHEGYENIFITNPVVTLGIFDGVHLGHSALLNCLISRAKEVNGESVVITFSPHPRIVLDKNSVSLSFLTTMEEKIALLEKAHIDHLIIIEFNTTFSNIRACDFIIDILVGKIRTKHLIIGFNHHFGRRGEGDFNTIRQCTEPLDFTVEQLKGIHTEEGAISSSSIREALLTGHLDEANRWLGYSYSITGVIVSGRHIGRSIGFPTANIKPGDQYKLIPANGVYAVEVTLEGLKYPGMLSIGSNPTVNNDPRKRTIEVNIFDFEKDIYGNSISVTFMKRLRDEQKFDTTEKLAEQMHIDKQQVLLLFS